MPKHVDPPRFIRLPQVIEMTTLAKPTIYKYMAKGTFPKQIQIGGKSVVWNELSIRRLISHDVSKWSFRKGSNKWGRANDPRECVVERFHTASSFH